MKSTQCKVHKTKQKLPVKVVNFSKSFDLSSSPFLTTNQLLPLGRGGQESSLLSKAFLIPYPPLATNQHPPPPCVHGWSGYDSIIHANFRSHGGGEGRRVPSIIDYTGRLPPKGIPISGWRHIMKGKGFYELKYRK